MRQCLHLPKWRTVSRRGVMVVLVSLYCLDQNDSSVLSGDFFPRVGLVTQLFIFRRFGVRKWGIPLGMKGNWLETKEERCPRSGAGVFFWDAAELRENIWIIYLATEKYCLKLATAVTNSERHLFGDWLLLLFSFDMQVTSDNDWDVVDGKVYYVMVSASRGCHLEQVLDGFWADQICKLNVWLCYSWNCLSTLQRFIFLMPVSVSSYHI